MQEGSDSREVGGELFLDWRGVLGDEEVLEKVRAPVGRTVGLLELSGKRISLGLGQPVCADGGGMEG